MDIHDIIKKEDNDEDTNENYLQIDFDIGVKVENVLAIEDWSIENCNQYQAHIDFKEHFDDSKSELKAHCCAICFRMFSDSYTLYQHNLTHLQVILSQSRWLYQCDYCLCYCERKQGIRKHILTKHYLLLKSKIGSTSSPMQRCLICNKLFVYKTWHSHMEQVHGTQRCICKICNYVFKCPRYLKRHMLKHVKTASEPVIISKDIQCDLCPRTFSHRYNYRVHLKNCHSDHSYECGLCHSKLKSRSYLLAHIKRVHYNDGKLYPCDICSKEFKSPRYLSIHKKNSHTVKIKKVKF